MALVNAGTKVSVSADVLPTGYTFPTVATFTDWEYKKEHTFTIAKSGVQHATATTTVGNLVTAVNSAAAAIITDDFDIAGLTSVTMYTDIRTIRENKKHDEVMYTSGTANYIVTAVIYAKTVA